MRTKSKHSNQTKPAFNESCRCNRNKSSHESRHKIGTLRSLPNRGFALGTSFDLVSVGVLLIPYQGVINRGLTNCAFMILKSELVIYDWK